MVGGACQGMPSPERSARPTEAGLRSASGPRSPRCENLRDARGAPWPLGPPDVRRLACPATRQLNSDQLTRMKAPAEPASELRLASAKPGLRSGAAGVQPGGGDLLGTTAGLSDEAQTAEELSGRVARTGRSRAGRGRTRSRASGSPGAEGYLGKASRRPPSTVRIQPVVFAERGETKKATASATSPGRILVFKRLRF